MLLHPSVYCDSLAKSSADSMAGGLVISIARFSFLSRVLAVVAIVSPMILLLTSDAVTKTHHGHGSLLSAESG